MSLSRCSLSRITSNWKSISRIRELSSSIVYKRNFTLSKSFSPLRIILVGAPGSGKGTQAAQIEHDYGPIPISSGDMLRQIKNEGSELGNIIKKQMTNGGLISDDILLDLIKHTLKSQTTPEKGWILDGYPRNPNQALQLNEVLRSLHQPLNVVFYLKVLEDVIIGRLQGRWVHPPSGRIYNVEYRPPKVFGKDDITGEPLIQREDDQAETIRARFKTFRESTYPLIDFYRQQGNLIEIESATSAEGYVKIKEVLDQILAENLRTSTPRTSKLTFCMRVDT